MPQIDVARLHDIYTEGIRDRGRAADPSDYQFYSEGLDQDVNGAFRRAVGYGAGCAVVLSSINILITEIYEPHPG